MEVRLFTDASCCSLTKIGGWGCVGYSDRGRLSTGGAFKSFMKDTAIAEMCALANGLFAVLSTGIARPHDTIIARTDNKYTVLVNSGHKKRLNENRREALKMIDDLVSVYDVHLIVKHVRAHASSREGGHSANHEADRISRKHMREARKEIWGPI